MSADVSANYFDSAQRTALEQEAKSRLRDKVATLREPAGATTDKSPTREAFQVGPIATPLEGTDPNSGHLGSTAYKELLDHLSKAGQAHERNDVAARDMHTDRAATAVSKDFARQKGSFSELRDQARSTAVFEARKLGEKVGLDPVSSSAVGYALERSLEAKGFKVVANQAIDGIAKFANSTASAASRLLPEVNLDRAMSWMASHGVSADALKNTLKQHSGKFAILAEVAGNPGNLKVLANAIASSDKAVDVFLMLKNDKEVREAAGTLLMGSGETLVKGPGLLSSVGALAMTAGSVLKDDENSLLNRHAFKAGLSILGGAAGAIGIGAVSAGTGSWIGGTAGAMAGSAVADAVIAIYDKFTGKEASNERVVSKSDMQDSAKTLADRGLTGGRDKLVEEISSRQDASSTRGLGRELEMSYSKSPAPGAG